jgi:AcrR family transcriptional regulator
MKTRLSKGEAKTHILNTAVDLFSTHGIRAVGIDTIVAQSGVAKTTLYDHYPSKDALITAYLDVRDAQFFGMIGQAESHHADDPKAQLIAIFEAMDALITLPQFNGCPFLSASAEFPELDQAAHESALAHKTAMRDRFIALAQAGGAADAHSVGEQLLLILDGAFSSKRVFRSAESPVRQLLPLARMIIDAHLP